MRNNTDKPMHDPEHPDDPLMPGMVRDYTMFPQFNCYEDITIEEDTRRAVEWANDPFAQIFLEEIRKEIDAEVIRQICNKALEK